MKTTMTTDGQVTKLVVDPGPNEQVLLVTSPDTLNAVMNKTLERLTGARLVDA